jgi:hypothetical protein
MKRCHACGFEWAGFGQPGTKAECENCSADLHACLNCRFYDTHKPAQCLLNNIDPVMNKERFNYCDEFQFADKKESAGKDEAKTSRDQFDKLFKKPS